MNIYKDEKRSVVEQPKAKVSTDHLHRRPVDERPHPATQLWTSCFGLDCSDGMVGWVAPLPPAMLGTKLVIY